MAGRWWRGPIEHHQQGIFCDNDECDFHLVDVPREDYPLFRNKPCPACGQNLFTDADWNAMRRVEIMVGIINTLLFFLPRPKPGDPVYRAAVKFNGKGGKLE